MGTTRMRRQINAGLEGVERKLLFLTCSRTQS